ncbi:MAG: GNAT family N-acetyltransferase [Burkholderiales bacterium]|nr:GNAT family N-acetyltransferase [Burkholderiales bacterium]
MRVQRHHRQALDPARLPRGRARVEAHRRRVARAELPELHDPPVSARSHHRTGLARRLWADARARALASGAGRFTVNSSLGAVQVYRAFGFVPTGEVASVHGISYLPMRLEETPAPP